MLLRFDAVDRDVYILDLGDRCDTSNGLATETELLLANPKSQVESCPA